MGFWWSVFFAQDAVTSAVRSAPLLAESEPMTDHGPTPQLKGPRQLQYYVYIDNVTQINVGLLIGISLAELIIHINSLIVKGVGKKYMPTERQGCSCNCRY